MLGLRWVLRWCVPASHLVVPVVTLLFSDVNVDCEIHCSTNLVQHSVAPSAWQSFSLIKCQILAGVLMIFRLSHSAYLAFWAS